MGSFLASLRTDEYPSSRHRVTRNLSFPRADPADSGKAVGPDSTNPATRAPRAPASPRRLDPGAFPRAAAKNSDRNHRQHRKADGQGEEHPGRPQVRVVRKTPRERQLKEPEHEQVDEGGGAGIACSIERLADHHAERI